MQQTPLPPAAPGQLSIAEAIKLLQAQIAGLEQQIVQLRQELVPGTTDARESVITSQIDAAQERIASLQGQLDRLVSGEAGLAVPPPFREEGIPQDVKDVIQWSMITLVVLALGIPLMRAVARRLDPRRSPPPAPEDQSPRLERLEQAVDAVAIEVERISEGQRFTNKLLGDLKALPAPDPMAARPLAQVREKLEERR